VRREGIEPENPLNPHQSAPGGAKRFFVAVIKAPVIVVDPSGLDRISPTIRHAARSRRRLDDQPDSLSDARSQGWPQVIAQRRAVPLTPGSAEATLYVGPRPSSHRPVRIVLDHGLVITYLAGCRLIL
jgi:hypothetical protein